MITYPTFVAALVDVDLAGLADDADVPVATIRAILEGGRAASFGVRMKLARALDANPLELFRLDEDLEQALAGAPSRYVSDPTTLRIVDRPRGVA